MIPLADAHSASAGPIGLLVVVLLAVVTVLLVRNMNSRLRKLPREFPDPPVSRPEDGPSDPA